MRILDNKDRLFKERYWRNKSRDTDLPPKNIERLKMKKKGQFHDEFWRKINKL